MGQLNLLKGAASNSDGFKNDMASHKKDRFSLAWARPKEQHYHWLAPVVIISVH